MNLEVDGTKKIVLVEDSQGLNLVTETNQVALALAGISEKGPQGDKGDKGDTGFTGIITATAPIIYNESEKLVSLNTGTGNSQVVLGNDNRLSNNRVPVDASVTDAKINGTLSQSKVTNLVSDLSTINTSLSNKSDSTHTHTTISNFLTINGDSSGANALNALSANNKKIIHIADPIADDDAASKQYVDRVSVGIQTHDAVELATTGSNITLSGAQKIDNVDVVGNGTLTSYRILVKDQTDAKQNGIYWANTSGAWARVTDMSGSTNADWKKNVVGAYVYVNRGDTLANVSYLARVANLGVETIGGSTGDCTINFGKFSSLSINAGNGISISGPTISAVGSNSIDSSGSINAIVKSGGGISGGTSDASKGLYIANNAITSDMLSTSGVTANTYTKVTVDTKGRVTSGAQAAPTDLSPAAAVANHSHTMNTSHNFIIQGNIITSTSLPVPPFYAIQGWSDSNTTTIKKIIYKTATGSVDFRIKCNSLATVVTAASTGNITVNSTSGFPSVGLIQIEDEIISYTSTSSTQFLGCTRGYDVTSGASYYTSNVSHVAGTAVHAIAVDAFRASSTKVSSVLASPFTLVNSETEIELFIYGISSAQNLSVTLVLEHRLN